MHGKRKWLPGWQRVELVELCLDRGASRRQAAAWRRVSVATVQYWVERYRAASEQERASGAWAQDRSCRRITSQLASVTRSMTACVR